MAALGLLTRQMRKLSLQSRFMVYFGIVVVLLMTGVIFVVENRQATSILDQTRMRGESIGTSLASVVSNSLISYDYPSLQTAADEATGNAGVSYVVILDKEGEVAGFSGQPDRQHERLTDDLTRRALAASSLLIQETEYDLGPGQVSQHLDITVPVFVKTSPVKWGTLRVGLSLADMHEELAETRRTLISLAVAAILIVLVAAMGLVTGRASTEPVLGELSGAMAESAFLEGDRVLSVAGVPTETLDDVVGQLTRLDGQPVPAVVERDGREREIELTVAASPVIRAVLPATPASRAGIEPGDLVLAIDGEPIETYHALRVAAADSPPGEPFGHREQVRQPGKSVDRHRLAVGSRTAAGNGRCRFHRYLLPEHGPDREFESVPGTGHADARIAIQQTAE